MAHKKRVYTSEKTGETKSILEWSKDSGINKTTLSHRLLKGMTIDEAIETPIDPSESKIDSPLTDPVTGETHSIKEWANIIGISADTLYARIYKHKWPIDKALHSPKFAQVKIPKPPKHVDLTGRKFGMLTVLRRADEDYVYMNKGKEHREWKWRCKCDCEEGNEVDVIQHNLFNGHTTNCGCSNKNRVVDMTGKKCGHLTVIRQVTDKSERDPNIKGAQWLCECDCENRTRVIRSGADLRKYTKDLSCGCRLNSAGGLSSSDPKVYYTHRNMLRRCNNENDQAYKDYGARGIGVCDEWMPDENGIKREGILEFQSWYNSNGFKDKEGLTLERIDNDSGYSAENCKAATMTEQARNRRNNTRVTYKNETKTIVEWSEIVGIPAKVIGERLRDGWSVEEALETPVRTKTGIEAFGEIHTTTEWSEISGVSRSAIDSRVKRGWTAEAAITAGATNPEIFNHIPCNLIPLYFNFPPAVTMPAIMYYDILGNPYTPEEWEAHQAVYFD